MDKPITKIVKSKSSNSTSENKKNTQKKSRSNAEFQPNATIYTQGIQPLLKKRGVYVEKKATASKISISNRTQSPDVLINRPQPISPRAIPRPDRKRFLASVLNILSQSTTGTQCPDGTDKLMKMDKTKNKGKKRRNEEVIEEHSVATPNSSKRKPKYRSRVLNNNDDSEVDPLLVLQSTKAIAQTPSNNPEFIHDKNTVSTYIDPETLRWADSLPPLDHQNLNTTAPVATISKKVIDKEPTTMNEDVPKSVDKQFYNFFVDVLKTGFNVYNVKTELKKELPTSAYSSKVALEIHESVARKLNSMQTIKETSDVSRKTSSKYIYKQLWEHHPDFSKQYTVESPKRGRKLKSDSFNYRNSKPLSNTTSLSMPNRRQTQKINRKKDFINSLKEQLKMKTDTYKEPQNFYEALKVIAKNKIRCKQVVDFGVSKRPSDGDVHVCQFKRRRVLSAKTIGKQSNYYPETRLDSFTLSPYIKTRYKKRKIIADREYETDESTHSLEVVGYDYVTNKKAKDHSQSNCAMRPGTPSTLVEDTLGVLDYTESGTSTTMFQSIKGNHNCG